MSLKCLSIIRIDNDLMQNKVPFRSRSNILVCVYFLLKVTGILLALDVYLSIYFGKKGYLKSIFTKKWAKKVLATKLY